MNKELIVSDGTTEINETDVERDINSVYIPASVTRIGTRAFSGCTCLQNVEIEEGPASLEIGEGAFENCTALTSIELPGRTSRILNGCFRNAGLEFFSIGGGGDFIAKGYNLFDGCPCAELALSALIAELQFRNAPLLQGIHHHRLHTFAPNPLREKLRDCGCDTETLANGVRKIFERMTGDADFEVMKYATGYEATCECFAQISNWDAVPEPELKSLVVGEAARQVARIDFGEIVQEEWDRADKGAIRSFCAELKALRIDQVDEYRTRFYSFFTNKRHHAAFHRMLAIAQPDAVVQIPAIAKVVPLYEWLTGKDAPKVEQAEWLNLSGAVRQALTQILVGKNKYEVGVSAWYLAEAFRDDLNEEDAKRRRTKVRGWMKEFGLLK